MPSFKFEDLNGRKIVLVPHNIVGIEPMLTADQYDAINAAVQQATDPQQKAQAIVMLENVQQLMDQGATATVVTVGGMSWPTKTPYTELEQQLDSMLEDIR